MRETRWADPEVLHYWANPWQGWSKPLALHHFPSSSSSSSSMD